MTEKEKTTRLYTSRSGFGSKYDGYDMKGRTATAIGEVSSRVAPALLVEKQVASFLNVSVQALRKWRANGVGPAWSRMEGCIRYPIEGLYAYIAETQCNFTGQDKTRSTSTKGGARHG